MTNLSDVFALSPVDFISVFNNLNDHLEIKEKIKSVIPTITNNGIKTVDPTFQNKVLNLDPLNMAEDIFGVSLKEGGEKALACGLTTVALRNGLMTVVQEMTQDFSERNSTWEEYIAGVESLGFRQILKETILKEKVCANDDDREEDFVAYWHDTHSILWCIDSYTMSDLKKVNGSRLYLNGKLRNKENQGYELQFSRGYVYCTNIQHLELDMREMPVYQYFKTIELFEPVEYWADFNCFDSDFYCNMSKVEENIQKKMLQLNVIDPSRRLKKYLSSDFRASVQNVVDGLSESELVHSCVYCRTFQYVKERNSFVPDYALCQLQDMFNEKSLEHAQGMFAKLVGKTDRDVFSKYSRHYEAIIDILKPKELSNLVEHFKREGSDVRKLHMPDELFEKMKEKVEMQ